MTDSSTHTADDRATAAPAGPPGPPGPLPSARFVLGAESARGGMGEVYAARDTHLGRDVAVKVLQARLAGTAAERRFLDEATVTGQLQHPGVPPVYDLGRLPDGRPFLAMKLVKGVTLADLRRANAPVDVLGVFEGVCQAVGYAHAHGVIHRDLKPANVMVGAFGEVQVMDWGLARPLAGGRAPGPGAGGNADATTGTATAIGTPRNPDTPFTEYGSALGTPAFMAPEQAAGELDRVDRRSDVFGLGAVLCALLTGKPPFAGRAADEVRLNAVRGRTEAALARLDGCGADPDVVALCKRCLRFDPQERPADAGELVVAVAELRRAADDRARRAEVDRGKAEVRAAEQAKRRRAALWAAGVVAAVLLLGVGGITAGLVRADAARREAEAARQAEAEQTAVARAKEAEANAVVRFFEGKVFAAARPKGQDGGLGHDVTLRAAIAASLPALAAEFAAQPLVEARLRATLGGTLVYLGDAQAAAEQFARARAIHVEQHGPAHPDTLSSTNGLAVSYANLGRHADALALYEQNLAAVKQVHPPDHPATLMCANNLGYGYTNVGRHTDALALHEETLAALRRVLPPDHPTTLWSSHNVALARFHLGRYADALALHEETLAARRRALPPDHPDTLWSSHNVALGHAALDRPADALRVHQETLAARRRVLPPGHSDTLASLWGVAAALAKLGRGAEAVPLIDECVAAAAGKAVDPQMLPGVVGLRLRHFQAAADPAGCRATAAMWERLDRPGVAGAYNAACYRAVAAGLFARANQPAEANADADRAMAWLARAVAAGFADRGQLNADRDLDSLRERADFRAVLAGLPDRAPPR